MKSGVSDLRLNPPHSNSPHTLHEIPLAPRLHISDGTLQRARQVGMEQRPVEPIHERHPGRRSSLDATVRLAVLQLLRQIAAARRAGSVVAMRDHVRLVAADAAPARFLRALAPELLFVLRVLGGGGGAVLSANVRHAEDGLPALEGRRASWRGREAEAGGGEGPFGPAVVDAGEVPIHRVRGGVAIELVADVDEVLDGCNIDVIDRGEVKDDGFEGGFVGFDGDGSAAARARVVPGPILNCVLVDAVGVWDMAEGSLRRVWGRKTG